MASCNSGHGVVVRAARRAVSNPAWCRIFREISCFSAVNIAYWGIVSMLCPWQGRRLGGRGAFAPPPPAGT